MDDGNAFGGLAPSSTSPTDAGFQFDSALARWKKLRKGVREGARLHELEVESTKHRHHKVMVRLSYAGTGRPEHEGGDARPKHISEYLDAVGKWAKRRGFTLRYVWVGELQERGALHYHIVYWLPRRIHMPFADAQGWWKHGSTNLVPADSPIGYLTKYISKLRSKQRDGMPFPKGFRMHGCGGLSKPSREHRAHYLMPQWIQDLGSAVMQFRRAVGGGFFSKLTGQWWESPWTISYVERRPGLSALIHIRRKTAEV